MSSFKTLIQRLSTSAETLDEYLESDGRPAPSFDNDVLTSLPPNIEQARNEFIDGVQHMKTLALGPRDIYSEILFAFADEISLRAIYLYDLAKLVPIHGSTTFDDMSSKSGLSSGLIERFLRQAMGNHIFTEDPNQPGHVRHTAASRLLAIDPDVHDAVGLVTCELSPAGQRVFDALEIHSGDPQEPTETAWALHNNTKNSLFTFLAQHPERARRFGAGMRSFGRGQGWDLAHLVNGYDWRALDQPNVTIVDVGGGQGAVAQALAMATNHLRIIVQDLPGAIKDGIAVLPKDLIQRIKFEEHDFFSTQSIYGADVYFFRWILHNWSDKYCQMILGALLPALKPGARVIVYEFVLAEGPETRWTKRHPRNLDLLMLSQFNACERTAQGWEKLFQSVDARLRLQRIYQPAGSLMSIIEAVWTPE
ncbi:MAG: hypothetical protein M1822_002549 [Bathelium mastoideum]|nr:MAG: hypothetical protein M1822_002549 [Bathelium mastoideum]